MQGSGVTNPTKGSGIAVVRSGHTTTWGLILSMWKVMYLLQVHVTENQYELEHSGSTIMSSCVSQTTALVYILFYRWYSLQANDAKYEL